VSTHTPAEWATALSLGTGAYATGAALLLAFVDIEPGDFRRLIENPAGDRLLVAAATCRDHARTAAEQTALTAAALLLILTTPAGGTR